MELFTLASHTPFKLCNCLPACVRLTARLAKTSGLRARCSILRCALQGIVLLWIIEVFTNLKQVCSQTTLRHKWFFSPLFPSQPTISSKANCVRMAEFKFGGYNEAKGVLTATDGPQILQCIQLHLTLQLYVRGPCLKLWWLWNPLCSSGWGHRVTGPHQACSYHSDLQDFRVRVDAGQVNSQRQPAVRQVYRSRFPQPPRSWSSQTPRSW